MVTMFDNPLIAFLDPELDSREWSLEELALMKSHPLLVGVRGGTGLPYAYGFDLPLQPLSQFSPAIHNLGLAALLLVIRDHLWQAAPERAHHFENLAKVIAENPQNPRVWIPVIQSGLAELPTPQADPSESWIIWSTVVFEDLQTLHAPQPDPDPRGLLMAVREWEVSPFLSGFLSVASKVGLEWQEMDWGNRPWVWLDPERITSVEEAIGQLEIWNEAAGQWWTYFQRLLPTKQGFNIVFE